MMACNYDPNATDAGACEYAGPIYDCDGVTCLVDSDGDGFVTKMRFQAVRILQHRTIQM